MNGSVSDASLPSPAFSVNREKYCSVAEVVSAWEGFTVAVFPVGGIPPVVINEDGKAYHFGVEHEPEPLNYSHSEVNTYVAGAKLHAPQKPPRLVRKKFRSMLRQSIRILDGEVSG